MIKIITGFFTALGVLFFVLILIGAYVFIADPLKLKPIFLDSAKEGAPEATVENSDAHPLLSPTQEKALQAVGISPASLPSSITPEQETCFVEMLGKTRVEEIKAGDLPTVTEFLTSKSCLE